MKDIKDDIESLTKSKSTKSKIGSKDVGHRLTKQEKAAFNRGKQKGFISTFKRQRDNLSNVWSLWCKAENIPYIEYIRGRGDGQDMLVADSLDVFPDRKSTRLNSSHVCSSRMPSSA